MIELAQSQSEANVHRMDCEHNKRHAQRIATVNISVLRGLYHLMGHQSARFGGQRHIISGDRILDRMLSLQDAIRAMIEMDGLGQLEHLHTAAA